MAIVIEGNPQRIHPVYNPVKYYFDETDTVAKNTAGFRYIVDLYVYYDNITPSFLTRYKVAPRPIDGIGYIDIGKPLQDLVSYNFNPINNNEGYDASNSYIKYDLAIGKDVIERYAFTSIASVFLTIPQLIRITAAGHPFVNGSQIILEDDGEDYDGVYSVVNVTATTFDIQHSFVGSSTGTITWADRRSQVVMGHTFSSIRGYNAAESFKEFKDYTYLDFGLFNNLNTDRYALSNIPNNFRVTPTQDLWLNWLIDRFTTDDINISFTNSNGDFFTCNMWDNATGGDVQQIGMGPNNLPVLTTTIGTAPLIKATTEWYEFFTFFGFNQTSRRYRFYIDRRCKINDYEITFLDRRGSIGSYAFQLKTKTEITTKKESYNKSLGDLNTTLNKFDYNYYGHGNIVYNVDMNTTLTLNSNWMSEENSLYFEELITSPSTWIKIDGEYYSCMVEETSVERETQRNKKLIRKTIKVKLSNAEIINI